MYDIPLVIVSQTRVLKGKREKKEGERGRREGERELGGEKEKRERQTKGKERKERGVWHRSRLGEEKRGSLSPQMELIAENQKWWREDVRALYDQNSNSTINNFLTFYFTVT